MIDEDKFKSYTKSIFDPSINSRENDERAIRFVQAYIKAANKFMSDKYLAFIKESIGKEEKLGWIEPKFSESIIYCEFMLKEILEEEKKDKELRDENNLHREKHGLPLILPPKLGRPLKPWEYFNFDQRILNIMAKDGPSSLQIPFEQKNSTFNESTPLPTFYARERQNSPERSSSEENSTEKLDQTEGSGSYRSKTNSLDNSQNNFDALSNVEYLSEDHDDDEQYFSSCEEFEPRCTTQISNATPDFEDHPYSGYSETEGQCLNQVPIEISSDESYSQEDHEQINLSDPYSNTGQAHESIQHSAPRDSGVYHPDDFEAGDDLSNRSQGQAQIQDFGSTPGMASYDEKKVDDNYCEPEFQGKVGGHNTCYVPASYDETEGYDNRYVPEPEYEMKGYDNYYEPASPNSNGFETNMELENDLQRTDAPVEENQHERSTQELENFEKAALDIKHYLLGLTSNQVPSELAHDIYFFLQSFLRHLANATQFEGYPTPLDQLCRRNPRLPENDYRCTNNDIINALDDLRSYYGHPFITDLILSCLIEIEKISCPHIYASGSHQGVEPHASEDGHSYARINNGTELGEGYLNQEPQVIELSSDPCLGFEPAALPLGNSTEHFSGHGAQQPPSSGINSFVQNLQEQTEAIERGFELYSGHGSDYIDDHGAHNFPQHNASLEHSNPPAEDPFIYPDSFYNQPSSGLRSGEDAGLESSLHSEQQVETEMNLPSNPVYSESSDGVLSEAFYTDGPSPQPSQNVEQTLVPVTEHVFDGQNTLAVESDVHSLGSQVTQHFERPAPSDQLAVQPPYEVPSSPIECLEPIQSSQLHNPTPTDPAPYEPVKMELDEPASEVTYQVTGYGSNAALNGEEMKNDSGCLLLKQPLTHEVLSSPVECLEPAQISQLHEPTPVDPASADLVAMELDERAFEVTYQATGYSSKAALGGEELESDSNRFLLVQSPSYEVPTSPIDSQHIVSLDHSGYPPAENPSAYHDSIYNQPSSDLNSGEDAGLESSLHSEQQVEMEMDLPSNPVYSESSDGVLSEAFYTDEPSPQPSQNVEQALVPVTEHVFDGQNTLVESDEHALGSQVTQHFEPPSSSDQLAVQPPYEAPSSPIEFLEPIQSSQLRNSDPASAKLVAMELIEPASERIPKESDLSSSKLEGAMDNNLLEQPTLSLEDEAGPPQDNFDNAQRVEVGATDNILSPPATLRPSSLVPPLNQGLGDSSFAPSDSGYLGGMDEHRVFSNTTPDTDPENLEQGTGLEIEEQTLDETFIGHNFVPRYVNLPIPPILLEAVDETQQLVDEGTPASSHSANSDLELTQDLGLDTTHPHTDLFKPRPEPSGSDYSQNSPERLNLVSAPSKRYVQKRSSRPTLSKPKKGGVRSKRTRYSLRDLIEWDYKALNRTGKPIPRGIVEEEVADTDEEEVKDSEVEVDDDEEEEDNEDEMEKETDGLKRKRSR